MVNWFKVETHGQNLALHEVNKEEWLIWVRILFELFQNDALLFSELFRLPSFVDSISLCPSMILAEILSEIISYTEHQSVHWNLNDQPNYMVC